MYPELAFPVDVGSQWAERGHEDVDAQVELETSRSLWASGFKVTGSLFWGHIKKVHFESFLGFYYNKICQCEKVSNKEPG